MRLRGLGRRRPRSEAGTTVHHDHISSSSRAKKTKSNSTTAGSGGTAGTEKARVRPHRRLRPWQSRRSGRDSTAAGRRRRPVSDSTAVGFIRDGPGRTRQRDREGSGPTVPPRVPNGLHFEAFTPQGDGPSLAPRSFLPPSPPPPVAPRDAPGRNAPGRTARRVRARRRRARGTAARPRVSLATARPPTAHRHGRQPRQRRGVPRR